jgi:hypothetical protein
LAAEAEVEAVVDGAFALEAVADAGGDHGVDGALFEHAGADGGFDGVAGAALDDDAVNTLEVQEVGEEKAGGAGADDAYLRAV